jgi:hypothetical protein
MADKKKLTVKEKEDMAFKNMAIDYIGQLHSRVSQMEQVQAKQSKYQAKRARSKARANRAKAAKSTRNLKGFRDSLDRGQWRTWGGNPFDK